MHGGILLIRCVANTTTFKCCSDVPISYWVHVVALLWQHEFVPSLEASAVPSIALYIYALISWRNLSDVTALLSRECDGYGVHICQKLLHTHKREWTALQLGSFYMENWLSSTKSHWSTKQFWMRSRPEEVMERVLWQLLVHGLMHQRIVWKTRILFRQKFS